MEKIMQSGLPTGISGSSTDKKIIFFYDCSTDAPHLILQYKTIKMKKTFIFSLCVAITIAGNAQIKKTDSVQINKAVINSNLRLKEKIITAPIQQTNSTTTTPTSSSTTTTQKQTASTSTATAPAATKTDADYYLSVVKTTIKTGSDNKEYPSSLRIFCYCGNKTGQSNKGFFLLDYTNELSKNNTTTLLVPKRSDGIYYDAAENSLAAYKQSGLRFVIQYHANLSLDAWKIESISLTLEFKDAAGNPHPTMGSKTISFTDSNLWMDGFDKVVTVYKTDTYFNALPVAQGPLGFWNYKYQ